MVRDHKEGKRKEIQEVKEKEREGDGEQREKYLKISLLPLTKKVSLKKLKSMLPSV